MPLTKQQLIFAAQEAAGRKSYARNIDANEAMKVKAQDQLAAAQQVNVAGYTNVLGNDRSRPWGGKGLRPVAAPAPARVVAAPAPAPEAPGSVTPDSVTPIVAAPAPAVKAKPAVKWTTKKARP